MPKAALIPKALNPPFNLFAGFFLILCDRKQIGGRLEMVIGEEAFLGYFAVRLD